MTDLRRPDFCPECKSPRVRLIQWGRPTEERMETLKGELDRDETTLGGCTITPLTGPSWDCGACHHRWADETDPAQQALRERETRILESIKRKREARP